MAAEKSVVTAANETATEMNAPFHVGAVPDDAHIGHIHGALGTIRHGDTAPRIGLRARSLLGQEHNPAEGGDKN